MEKNQNTTKKEEERATRLLPTAICRFFAGRHLVAGDAQATRARLLLNFSLVTALLSIIYALNALLIDFVTSSLVMPIAALAFTGIAFLLRTRLSLFAIGYLYLICSWIPAVLLAARSGGIYSALVPWFGYIPMAANLLLNRRQAWIWLWICISTLIAFGIAQQEISNLSVEYTKSFEIAFYVLAYAGLFFIILIMSMIFSSARDGVVLALDEKNRETGSLNEELRHKQLETMAQNTRLQQSQRELERQSELLEAKNRQLIKIHGELEKTIGQLNRAQQALRKKETGG